MCCECVRGGIKWYMAYIYIYICIYIYIYIYVYIYIYIYVYIYIYIDHDSLCTPNILYYYGLIWEWVGGDPGPITGNNDWRGGGGGY